MLFHRDIFLHKDRPSKTKHDQKDSKVSVYQEQIKTKIYDSKFKVYELENYIKSLESTGQDSISNEFFKF